MRRFAVVIPMPQRRVDEIVCRCWPELHAGRFIPAGTLVQLGRRSSADDEGTDLVPELAETRPREPCRFQGSRAPALFADRRGASVPRDAVIEDEDSGPFDDAA
jgi:hypothetical protein